MSFRDATENAAREAAGRPHSRPPASYRSAARSPEERMWESGKRERPSAGGSGFTPDIRPRRSASLRVSPFVSVEWSRGLTPIALGRADRVRVSTPPQPRTAAQRGRPRSMLRSGWYAAGVGTRRGTRRSGAQLRQSLLWTYRTGAGPQRPRPKAAPTAPGERPSAGDAGFTPAIRPVGRLRRSWTTQSFSRAPPMNLELPNRIAPRLRVGRRFSPPCSILEFAGSRSSEAETFKSANL